nr:hypothetical protein [Tanacetum cinerariifolium]
PEWSRHVTIVHQNKDLHTVDYTQLYDFLNIQAKLLNTNQQQSENFIKPEEQQIAQPGMNIGEDRQMQMVRGYSECCSESKGSEC